MLAFRSMGVLIYWDGGVGQDGCKLCLKHIPDGVFHRMFFYVRRKKFTVIVRVSQNGQGGLRVSRVSFFAWFDSATVRASIHSLRSSDRFISEKYLCQR